jgi:hypothetical protein
VVPWPSHPEQTHNTTTLATQTPSRPPNYVHASPVDASRSPHIHLAAAPFCSAVDAPAPAYWQGQAAGAISVAGKAVHTLYPPLGPLSHNANPRDGAQDIMLCYYSPHTSTHTHDTLSRPTHTHHTPHRPALQLLQAAPKGRAPKGRAPKGRRAPKGQFAQDRLVLRAPSSIPSCRMNLRLLLRLLRLLLRLLLIPFRPFHFLRSPPSKNFPPPARLPGDGSAGVRPFPPCAR